MQEARPSFEARPTRGNPAPQKHAGVKMPPACFFNCILEQGVCRGPAAPSFEGDGEAGAARRPQEKGTGRASARRQARGSAPPSRQHRGRSGSPGTRLGRPFGPGFALRPGLIGRKDHGRRRAQAARQSRTANRGRRPLNKTQAQAPSSPSSPCSPQAAARGSGRLRAGSCRDSPALSRRGPVPAKMRGIFTGPAPAY